MEADETTALEREIALALLPLLLWMMGEEL